MEKKLVKPKLGSNIYLRFICGGAINIYKVKVIAKGTDIFFHSGSLERDVVDRYKEPLRYDEYYIIWFKTLKDVRKRYHKLKKLANDCWEVE